MKLGVTRKKGLNSTAIESFGMLSLLRQLKKMSGTLHRVALTRADISENLFSATSGFLMLTGFQSCITVHRALYWYH